MTRPLIDLPAACAPGEDPAFDVAVVGLGYIGLPTAAVLANSGLRVRGVDTSRRVVETIEAGGVHIEERDLDALVHDTVASGMLTVGARMPRAETYLIAVPTPLGKNRTPDIAAVLAAARAVAPALRPGASVILESTSPIGTTQEVAALIAALRPDLRVPGHVSGAADLAIAYCPERVLPGRIIAELTGNDRVIGGITEPCAERAAGFYRRFVEGECVLTSAPVAEMVKLAENSFRDVNIAFANELSLIAERLGIDVWEVIALANRHPRVNVLRPGPGVGGHCIAVDPWFLVASAPEHARLIRTARRVNDGKAAHVAERLAAMLDAEPGAKLALLGLAFKPDIDDFRESPALAIAELLATDYGERLMVVEPFTDALPGALAESGARMASLEEAMAACELVAVLVDHAAFRQAPAELAIGKTVYDTRGMWA